LELCSIKLIVSEFTFDVMICLEFFETTIMCVRFCPRPRIQSINFVAGS